MNYNTNKEIFFNTIKNELLLLDTFKIITFINDIYLKNYTYNPRLNTANKIVHEWEYSTKDKIITVKDIRIFITEEMIMFINNLQTEYLEESRYVSSTSEKNENLQRKIKKTAEIAIGLQGGIIFREFIDYYDKGYFN